MRSSTKSCQFKKFQSQVTIYSRAMYKSAVEHSSWEVVGVTVKIQSMLLSFPTPLRNRTCIDFDLNRDVSEVFSILYILKCHNTMVTVSQKSSALRILYFLKIREKF